jgi:PTH1 family peptidyl-tRNA hydrolase
VKWIVGLGNPGKRYAGTRHNVGFAVADLYAERHGFGAFRRKFSALIADRCLEIAGDEKVYLVKPQAYMNLSGQPVRDVLGYFGGETSDLLVVHDDLDLPLGRLRYRRSGSSGGHRGVASILEAFQSEEFARLKIGIGRREGQDPAEFVLDTVAPEERAVFDQAVARATESLDVWIREGVERAALLYNAPEPGREKKAEGDG